MPTKKLNKTNKASRPSLEDAKSAVRTLIAWSGDDPNRPELLDTPERVAKSYQEFFSGYRDIQEIENINCSFDNNYNYHEPIILKNIEFNSFCEHHMVPIIGKIAIAYIPDQKIIGLSKLARIAEHQTRRLQIQERLTVEIAEIVSSIVKPLGVAVHIDSFHACVALRGVKKHDAKMVTTCFTGAFKEKSLKQNFLQEIKQ